MKFSINKSELVNALSIVSKAITNRSTLPILTGVLIEAASDSIVLQSTDLEASIQYTVPALIEEPGKMCVNGKLLSDIVRALPEAAVHIQATEGDAQITCDTSTFSVRALNADDFPGFPKVETTQSITVPFAVFSSMVKRVSRFTSKDETRAILTGVLIETEDNKLKMVATDSYRLALSSVKIELNDSPEPFSAVVAGSFLSSVCQVLQNEGPVTLALSENQIIITCDNAVFINRRIEGAYPNYKNLIPEEFNTRATIDLATLASSVKRASVLSNKTAPMRFDLNSSTNMVQIFVNSTDVGSVQETLSCEITGEDVEIALNSDYVNDGLGSFPGQTILFDVISDKKPGVFRSVDADEDYLYFIMPVRL